MEHLTKKRTEKKREGAQNPSPRKWKLRKDKVVTDNEITSSKGQVPKKGSNWSGTEKGLNQLLRKELELSLSTQTNNKD